MKTGIAIAPTEGFSAGPGERLSDHLIAGMGIPLPRPVTTRLLGLDEADEVWSRAAEMHGHLFERLLAALDITNWCAEGDQRLIPSAGPVIVVANHPHGILDGILIGALVRRVRQDLRILASSMLNALPERVEEFIPVDVLGQDGLHRTSVRALLAAKRWLRQGGILVVFPAAEVARFRVRGASVADSRWNDSFAWLAEQTGAQIVPAFIGGGNSRWFHAASLLHKSLGTAMLMREVLKKRGCCVGVRIGRPLNPEIVSRLGGSRQSADYARFRVDLMGKRDQRAPARALQGVPTVESVAASLLAGDVDGLAPEAMVYSCGEHSVYLAKAAEIPHALREIGRLREVSFRAEGEGTGQAIDLDRFDEYYRHLFVWNSERREIVAAYRLGFSDEILPGRGPAGFYTTTLFRFPRGWWDRVAPGIELGRSFVRLEDQRSFGALPALWRGIGSILARYPHYRYLFGPVSISGRYGAASKQLIEAYLESLDEKEQNEVVRGLTPPRPDRRWQRAVKRQPLRLLRLEEIDAMVQDLEPDGEGIPVLLRHYMRLGGRVLAFNEDAAFSAAVDALLLVDTFRVEPRRLDRFCGPGVSAKIRAAAAAGTDPA